MRKQHPLWPSTDGFDTWDVDRLIDQTQNERRATDGARHEALQDDVGHGGAEGARPL